MHAVFEQMAAVRVDRAKGVTIRAGVWQEWMTRIRTDVQPQLDAAQALVDKGFTAEARPTDVQPMRTRRSA